MKANTMKFYAQLAIEGALVSIGTIALIGEPTDDANFIATIIGQMIVLAVSWTAAYLLNRKWQILRKLEYTGLFQ